MSRILLIRMLEMGDVASIAVPAIRYLLKKYPDTSIDLLTREPGCEILKLAAPEVQTLTLENDWWPDNILTAMEAFLGLAEKIIGHEYQKIINLDTAFMPCFLARFLKDAGEPVEGNMLSISVQQLIDRVHNQSLQPEYVNNQQNYMQSTYFGMYKWHTPWWEGAVQPDKGYPEFYLKACCGWTDLEMDWDIAVPMKQSSGRGNIKKVTLAVCSSEYQYPQQDELTRLLKQQGVEVAVNDPNQSIAEQLAGLKSSDLLVTLPLGVFALANSVACPTLLLCGQVDPRMLMPDYATDMANELPDAASLCESIMSIFSEDQHD
ncbi:hypothetical protein [Aliiglaciecola sp. LCG003]|uniref:hypothetical protein n=1 Tax=Aliiglaciecola sp. LCG003 TaxID=3053655 RepID=UPI00257318F8|nr:hypothetical protein [Aliiglaciecola sp. LCG003]WJG10571.1 hypothetical protein QR722_05895 [Aliiglaciecola sp. LCG003]